MSGEFLAVLRLVERAVEGGKEEHKHLSAHTCEKHDVGSRKVSQLEERTEDNDRGAPAIRIVEEGLSGDTVHPFLKMVDYVEFAIYCHDVWCLEFI